MSSKYLCIMHFFIYIFIMRFCYALFIFQDCLDKKILCVITTVTIISKYHVHNISGVSNMLVCVWLKHPGAIFFDKFTNNFYSLSSKLLITLLVIQFPKLSKKVLQDSYYINNEEYRRQLQQETKITFIVVCL